MRTFTAAEIQEIIIDTVNGISPCEMQTDNQGQLVIYFGIFRQQDGTYAEQPDPNQEEES
jgi:hypothetical protein